MAWPCNNEYFLEIAKKLSLIICVVMEFITSSFCRTLLFSFHHREPTQSVSVADCYFIVNVLDLPFASPIAIYR